MSDSEKSNPAVKLGKSQYPRCLRCNKRVDFVAVNPEPRHAGNFIVEYQCHGESVSQEMEAFEIDNGLATYTAFNAFTSGLLPDPGAIKAAKEGAKK